MSISLLLNGWCFESNVALKEGVLGLNPSNQLCCLSSEPQLREWSFIILGSMTVRNGGSMKIKLVILILYLNKVIYNWSDKKISVNVIAPAASANITVLLLFC